MHTLLKLPAALWALFRLGVKTRFRLNSPYWNWRIETAFTADPAKRPPLRARINALIEYGHWVHRMNSLL